MWVFVGWAFKGSVELGGQAPLLHRPGVIRGPLRQQEESGGLEIKERENRRETGRGKVKREIDIDKEVRGRKENVVHNSSTTHPALTAAALGMALHWVMPGP